MVAGVCYSHVKPFSLPTERKLNERQRLHAIDPHSFLDFDQLESEAQQLVNHCYRQLERESGSPTN